MNHLISQDKLRDLFHYDCDSGLFSYKTVAAKCIKIGDVAGSLSNLGYWRITISGKKYMAHSLAWLYVYGKYRPRGLDHINGNSGDNRIVNLREATQSQNNANTRKYSCNTSGYKGIYKLKCLEKWQAHIRVDGHKYHLGVFPTKEEAHAAYCAAAIRYFGEFARMS